MSLFENIAKVEKNMSLKENIYRDLTFLAGEVYSNTDNGLTGVSCTSIRQLMPSALYSSVYSNVKTRIINLLCLHEPAGIDINKLDIKKDQIISIKEKNNEIYKTVVSDGMMFTFVSKEKKITWNILVPIITWVVSSRVSGVLVY